MHVEALFTRDSVGRLVRINEPRGGTAPRFFLGRTKEGTDVWLRDDLEEELVAELEALAERGPSGIDVGAAEAARFEAILARSAAVGPMYSGPAFAFPSTLTPSQSAVQITAENADLLRPLLNEWHNDAEDCQPLFAVVLDGHAVAVCGSVRRSTRAHEAGVETAEEHRRKGHATAAVSSWASAVVEAGRLPLYSTSWSNRASLALARRLGLVQFATDLYIA